MLFKKTPKDSLSEQEKVQQEMMKLFPSVHSLPINSVAHTLYYKSPAHPVLTFLIIGNNDKLMPFIIDPVAEVHTRASAYAQPNKYGKGKDLVIRFEFALSEGIAIFETILVGDDPDWMRTYVSALKKMDSFMVWIVDAQRNVLKVLRTNWDYKMHKHILKSL